MNVQNLLENNFLIFKPAIEHIPFGLLLRIAYYSTFHFSTDTESLEEKVIDEKSIYKENTFKEAPIKNTFRYIFEFIPYTFSLAFLKLGNFAWRTTSNEMGSWLWRIPAGAGVIIFTALHCIFSLTRLITRSIISPGNSYNAALTTYPGWIGKILAGISIITSITGWSLIGALALPILPFIGPLIAKSASIPILTKISGFFAKISSGIIQAIPTLGTASSASLHAVGISGFFTATIFSAYALIYTTVKTITNRFKQSSQESSNNLCEGNFGNFQSKITATPENKKDILGRFSSVFSKNTSCTASTPRENTVACSSPTNNQPG